MNLLTECLIIKVLSGVTFMCPLPPPSDPLPSRTH